MSVCMRVYTGIGQNNRDSNFELCSTSIVQCSFVTCRNSLHLVAAYWKVSVEYLPMCDLYEKIMLPAKCNYIVRLVRHVKRMVLALLDLEIPNLSVFQGSLCQGIWQPTQNREMCSLCSRTVREIRSWDRRELNR